MGDASGRHTRIDAERELQSSVQSSGAEIRNEELRGVGELDVETSQRVASGDEVDQSLADDEIASNELRFLEVASKAERIEKLRKAESVKITGEEIEHSDDLKQYKRNALEYGKTLRGQYTNLDTKRKIVLNRESLTEILHHDYKDVEHLQSIAAIPQIIEQAIFIGEEKSDGNKKIDSVEYYASGLSVKGVDYTVKSVISISENGTRYYDHKLTKIEKSELINLTSALSSTVSEENNSLLSEVKDKRLISILQDKSERNDGERPQSQLKYRANDSKQNQETTETVEQRLQKLTGKFGIESVSVSTKAELPLSIRNRSIGRRFQGAYDPTTGR